MTVRKSKKNRAVKGVPEKSDAGAVKGRQPDLATESAKLLSLVQGRLATFDSASTIWRDYLSDGERSSLGGKLVRAWRNCRGTLGIVSRARKCSKAEALLWLCEQTEALPAARIQQLRQELGLPKEAVGTTSPPEVPKWNKARSELLLGGEVIRRFRGAKIAHRVVAILDAFQECGWCDRIENPLPSRDPHDMREVVYLLNKGLRVIRFRSDGNGSGICWDRQ